MFGYGWKWTATSKKQTNRQTNKKTKTKKPQQKLVFQVSPLIFFMVCSPFEKIIRFLSLDAIRTFHEQTYLI